jgi:hypothetical protein
MPALAVLDGVTALPSRLAAHGVGSREDLPLPFTLVVVGAALALAVSFVALGVGWRDPKIGADDGLLLPRPVQRFLDTKVLRACIATAGLLLTAWTLLALVAGQDDANNPVPYVVFVWLWVGLAFASMLFGPVWHLVNPVRWLHRGILAAARISPDLALTERRVGYWPAAAGLFAFVWLELVAPDNTSLTTMRIAIAWFLLTDLILALVLGARAYRQADPLEAWSGLLGTLSALGRRTDRRWVIRTPIHGPSLLPPRPGLLATASVMLGSTAYDSFAGQPWWFTFVQGTDSPRTLETLGLLAMCLLVASLLASAAALSAGLARRPVRGMPSAFAPSLLPIAAGYLVAHYYSLFVWEGTNTLAKLSDPLGIGADWLGTAHVTPSSALIAPGPVAIIQVVAIVTGHVLGVVVAHERAVTLFDRRTAIVGQIPLLVLMVLYTVGGLTLLFSA